MNKKNLYKTNYKISSDTEFLLNLKKKKYRFLYINKNITIMRYGGLSTKTYYFFLKAIEDIKIFRKYHLSFFIYLKKVLYKVKQIKNIRKQRRKYFTYFNTPPRLCEFDPRALSSG